MGARDAADRQAVKARPPGRRQGSIRRRRRAGSGCRPAPSAPPRGCGRSRDGVLVDEFLGAGVGDGATLGDNEQMIGGLGHLAHEMAGEEHRCASDARLFIRLRIQTMPSGLKTVDRLIEIRMSGSPSSAAAIPSCSLIPSENVPTCCHLAEPDDVEHVADTGGGGIPLLSAKAPFEVVGRVTRPPTMSLCVPAAPPTDLSGLIELAIQLFAANQYEAQFGVSRPRIIRIVVSLPAPVGAQEPPTSFPAATTKETSSTATVSPVTLRQLLFHFDHCSSSSSLPLVFDEACAGA